MKVKDFMEWLGDKNFNLEIRKDRKSYFRGMLKTEQGVAVFESNGFDLVVKKVQPSLEALFKGHGKKNTKVGVVQETILKAVYVVLYNQDETDTINLVAREDSIDVSITYRGRRDVEASYYTEARGEYTKYVSICGIKLVNKVGDDLNELTDILYKNIT